MRPVVLVVVGLVATAGAAAAEPMALTDSHLDRVTAGQPVAVFGDARLGLGFPTASQAGLAPLGSDGLASLGPAAASEIDAHVGARMRQRREFLQ